MKSRRQESESVRNKYSSIWITTSSLSDINLFKWILNWAQAHLFLLIDAKFDSPSMFTFGIRMIFGSFACLFKISSLL